MTSEAPQPISWSKVLLTPAAVIAVAVPVVAGLSVLTSSSGPAYAGLLNLPVFFVAMRWRRGWPPHWWAFVAAATGWAAGLAAVEFAWPDIDAEYPRYYTMVGLSTWLAAVAYGSVLILSASKRS